MRKFSFILAILLTITLAVKPVYAVEDLKGDENDYSIELQQYLEELQQFVNEVNCNDAHDENLIDSYLEEYAQKLDTMGYENYIIDNENYDELYNYLNMDFEQMGIDRDGKYLVVFSNGESQQNAISRASNSSIYKYTYNGNEYTMRQCTVTAADSSHYAVAASPVNIYNSKSADFFINCINASICSYLDYISGPLMFGTIASIAGIDVSRIASNSKNATLYMHCSANWTRVFTQVYSTYDGMWMNCSSAEYVSQTQSMSGQYYDSVDNVMKDVNRDSKTLTQASQHYGDNEWLNRQAAIYFFNCAGCNYDQTGDVNFYYNNVKKVTIKEPSM